MSIMKILMLSLDGSILDKNSSSAGRMRDYGSICDELHIIILGKSGEKNNLDKNIFVYPTSGNRLAALLKAKNIGSKILSVKDEWVITSQDPFETGFIGWLLAQKYKIGLEVQLHGDLYGNKYWKNERLLNRFRWYLGKFILRRATFVRVVSERTRRSIEEINKNITTVPIFTERKELIKTQKDNNDFIILSVGNLVPVKNHKQLIEAFAEIKKQLPNAKLIIAGEGWLKKSLQLLVRNLQLGESVAFIGYQTNLDKYYGEADIFVHSSLYEGWGRAVIEAVFCGLPIIMTDVGLADEVIKNEESGLVVPVNDKEALKEAILRLAKDRGLANRLAQNARLVIENILLTKEEYLNKIKEIWNKIQ